MTWNIILCQDFLCVKRAGSLSWALVPQARVQQHCVWGVTWGRSTWDLSFCPGLHHRLSLLDVFALLTHVGHILTLVRLSSVCFPLTEVHLFCYILFSSVLRFKNLDLKSLKGVPAMCCKWVLCRSRHTEEKGSQILARVLLLGAGLQLTVSPCGRCLCSAMWLECFTLGHRMWNWWHFKAVGPPR